MSILNNIGKPWKSKTWEEFGEEIRECWDCHKKDKVKNLVCNVDYHYHCKDCVEKYYSELLPQNERP